MPEAASNSVFLRAVALATSLRLLVLVAFLDRPDQVGTWLYLTDPVISGLAGLLYVRWTMAQAARGRLWAAAAVGCLPFVLTWLFLVALDRSPEAGIPSHLSLTLLRTAAAGLLGGLLGHAFGPREFPYGA